jgi:hypothetical protein
MFLIAAYAKLSAGDGWPGRMVGFLDFQAEKSLGFHRDFVTAVVVPNKEVFGYMVAYGELSVGLSLLFSNNKDMLGLDNLAVKKWPKATRMYRLFN